MASLPAAQRGEVPGEIGGSAGHGPHQGPGDPAAIPRDQRPRVAVRVQDRPTDVDHDRGRRDRTENQVQRRQRGLPASVSGWPSALAGLPSSPDT